MPEASEEQVAALRERIRRTGRGLLWVRVGVGVGCPLVKPLAWAPGFGPTASPNDGGRGREGSPFGEVARPRSAEFDGVD